MNKANSLIHKPQHGTFRKLAMELYVMDADRLNEKLRRLVGWFEYRKLDQIDRIVPRNEALRKLGGDDQQALRILIRTYAVVVFDRGGRFFPARTMDVMMGYNTQASQIDDAKTQVEFETLLRGRDAPIEIN